MKQSLLVFVDTNIWLLPYLRKIDIFTELERLLVREKRYEVIISREVVNELKEIMKSKDSKGREKTAAKIALKLIEKNNVKILEDHDNETNVDDFILKLSQRYKDSLVLCTNDRELRRKIRNVKRIKKIIGMRKKNRLEFL